MSGFSTLKSCKNCPKKGRKLKIKKRQKAANTASKEIQLIVE